MRGQHCGLILWLYSICKIWFYLQRLQSTLLCTLYSRLCSIFERKNTRYYFLNYRYHIFCYMTPDLQTIGARAHTHWRTRSCSCLHCKRGSTTKTEANVLLDNCILIIQLLNFHLLEATNLMYKCNCDMFSKEPIFPVTLYYFPYVSIWYFSPYLSLSHIY